MRVASVTTTAIDTVKKGAVKGAAWLQGWKVLRFAPGSTYISCINDLAGAEVTYRPGRIARPRPGCGPLCVFSSEQGAQKFLAVIRGGVQLTWSCVSGMGFTVLPCEYLPSKAAKIWYTADVTEWLPYRPQVAPASVTRKRSMLYKRGLENLPSETRLAEAVRILRPLGGKKRPSGGKK